MWEDGTPMGQFVYLFAISLYTPQCVRMVIDDVIYIYECFKLKIGHFILEQTCKEIATYIVYAIPFNQRVRHLFIQPLDMFT